MSLITYLARVRFADFALEEGIAAELNLCGITRPLIVTDRTLCSDLFARFLDALPDAMIAPVQSIPDAPVATCVLLEAAAQYRRENCNGIVGFGGTAAVDMARLLAFTCADQSTQNRVLTGPASPLRDKGNAVPVIAVPTIAACGAGLGPCIRLVRGDAPAMTLIGPALLPTSVLCDPTLMSDETPQAMAAAVMDILVHCMETFLCSDWNPPADGIALEGLRRASAILDRAVGDKCDLGARRDLMAAALNGSLAGMKGLGGIHALAHALEDNLPGTPALHGHLHAALAPHVLEFNAPAVGERYRLIAEAMQLPAGTDVPTAFARLGERLSLPLRLGPLGIVPKAVKPIAFQAEADPTNRTNPRLATCEDYEAILLSAL